MKITINCCAVIKLLHSYDEDKSLFGFVIPENFFSGIFGNENIEEKERTRLRFIDIVLGGELKPNINKQPILVLKYPQNYFEVSNKTMDTIRSSVLSLIEYPIEPLKLSIFDIYLFKNDFIEKQELYFRIKLVNVYAYIFWKKRIRLNRFAVFRQTTYLKLLFIFEELYFERRSYLKYPQYYA